MRGPAGAILPGEYADFVLAATIRWISAGYFWLFDGARDVRGARLEGRDSVDPELSEYAG